MKTSGRSPPENASQDEPDRRRFNISWQSRTGAGGQAANLGIKRQDIGDAGWKRLVMRVKLLLQGGDVGEVNGVAQKASPQLSLAALRISGAASP
jgi:hypothetical protein